MTVSAPHRLGGGSEDIDFFSFLVGFAVLDALHSCEDGAGEGDVPASAAKAAGAAAWDVSVARSEVRASKGVRRKRHSRLGEVVVV